MRRLIVSVAFVLGLMTLAAAQDNSSPKPVLFEHGSFESRSTGTLRDMSWQGKTPSPCADCIFYGGDIDPNDPNADGFIDQNTILLPDSETFAAVTIPEGDQVKVQGLLFNVLASSDDFDPITATWEIRSGVSENNGGTLISQGSGSAKITPTGRVAFGYPENTVAVAVTPPIILTAGTYWFNVSPQCTNRNDQTCDTVQYFASNTTHGTNNVRGGLQPLHQMYFYSQTGEAFYENWCDAALGYNAHQCAALSFGIIGR